MAKKRGAASGGRPSPGSIGSILRLLTKSGNYSLIRRFMEPIYILRSFCSGKKTVRRILNAILLALSLLLLAGTIAGRLEEARTGTPAGVFGIKPVVVMSGSMEPALRTHSVSLVRLTSEVEEGDVVLFKSGGAYMLHRFLGEVPDNGDTAAGFIITGGDSNAEADFTPLPREHVLGRVVLPLNWTAPLVELFFKIRSGEVVRTAAHPLILPLYGPPAAGPGSGPGSGIGAETGPKPEVKTGPGPGASSQASISDTPAPLPEDRVLDRFNASREAAGLERLTVLPALAEAALIRAREAAVSWSHTRPDGSPWYTAGAGTAYGENLARGYRTPDEVCDAWMASPSHASNILFPDFRFVSIASYISGTGCPYWSAEFS